jgi:hypothetical protein
MQYGFITALRGSWNTTNPNDYRGFKVIFGHLASGTDTTVDYVSDFCSGFLTDSVKKEFWGRPVGIAIDKDGKVYISSDEGNKFILVLTPNKVTNIKNNIPTLSEIVVYPNPANGIFTLSAIATQSIKISAVLYDISGKKVRSLLEQMMLKGSNNYQLDVNGLPSGYYLLKVSDGNSTYNHKLLLKE